MPEENYAVNPITMTDYPDPDVIRVDDCYYMVSTTMYFMPGCAILRSYNLADWEIASYVYDVLEDNSDYRLENGRNAYGNGMWAASLRYHDGIFYIVFCANDTQKTYIFRSNKIEGPWKRNELNVKYHDNSILFDDDGRVFMYYGNRQIHCIQLDDCLTHVIPETDTVVIEDKCRNILGYEGTHAYKINGRYYLFFIHSAPGAWKRTQSCWMSDKPDTGYIPAVKNASNLNAKSANSFDVDFEKSASADVLNDDMDYCNSGVAQGGIVDTADGKWYGVLFQDRGAVGRIPCLVPVRWDNCFPVFGIDGKCPKKVSLPYSVNAHSGYKYKKLYTSDSFTSIRLDLNWQWNHNPDLNYARWGNGSFMLTTFRTDKDIFCARNTLTQRIMYPFSTASVTVDCSGLKDGDFAGLGILHTHAVELAITKQDGELYIVHRLLKADGNGASSASRNEITECSKIKCSQNSVTFRISVDVENMTDTAVCSYYDGKWNQLETKGNLVFDLAHFCGNRFALFYYSTKNYGGSAVFTDFEYTASRDDNA